MIEFYDPSTDETIEIGQAVKPGKRNTKNQQSPGRGRPKKTVTREIVKPLRWTPHDWAAVEAAALQCGMTPSAFIRGCVLSQVNAIAGK